MQHFTCAKYINKGSLHLQNPQLWEFRMLTFINLIKLIKYPKAALMAEVRNTWDYFIYFENEKLQGFILMNYRSSFKFSIKSISPFFLFGESTFSRTLGNKRNNISYLHICFDPCNRKHSQNNNMPTTNTNTLKCLYFFIGSSHFFTLEFYLYLINFNCTVGSPQVFRLRSFQSFWLSKPQCPVNS